MRKSVVIVLSAILTCLVAGPVSASESIRYLLGPEDHLTLKVWDLRNGEPYQWLALSGEFVVGADGTVSLPIVGELKARGLSHWRSRERNWGRASVQGGLGDQARPLRCRS